MILIVEEDDNRPLNELMMNQLGGSIHRFTFEEVESEIKHAKEVQDETSASTKENWMARHKK